MYSIITIRDTLSIPPRALGGKLDETVLEIAQKDYEGLVDEDVGVVITVTAAERVGEGKVIPGDGAIYYDVKMDMLVYKPMLQEVVEGFVSEITEFGAFIRTGPIEGLIHVSQIMDDYINYDAKLPGFVGKETKKKLVMEDVVLARTVTSSLKGSISASKVGYTMRQLGLGKKEWLKVDEKKAKAAEKKKAPAKEKKEEKK